MKKTPLLLIVAMLFAATVPAGLVLANGLRVLVHSGSPLTNNQRVLESGGDAGTAGVLTITFQSAFTSKPNCVATDEKAIPLACGAVSVTTAGAVFSCPTGTTEVINYVCIGDK